MTMFIYRFWMYLYCITILRLLMITINFHYANACHQHSICVSVVPLHFLFNQYSLKYLLICLVFMRFLSRLLLARSYSQRSLTRMNPKKNQNTFIVATFRSSLVCMLIFIHSHICLTHIHLYIFFFQFV